MAAAGLQGAPLASLEASAPAQARARAAALRAQAEAVRKRIDEAPSLSAPSEALSKALAALPPPPAHLPLTPPLPAAPTRVRYLRLCTALADATSQVDDAASFAALVSTCEALPPLALRDRLFDVLQARRPALLARSMDALSSACAALQWPHAPLSRALFPPANSAAALASVAQHLTALTQLAGHSAAAGALAGALAARLSYLSASLGAVAALPPLLDALQALLKALPSSALSVSLWPHTVAALLSLLAPRYAPRTATEEGGAPTEGSSDTEAEEEEMAAELDLLAQTLLDRYAYPPRVTSSDVTLPSALALMARRPSLQAAWAAQVERTGETRLREATEGSEAWAPLPVTETEYPALPSAAHALPLVLVPLFRRAPAASPAQRGLLQSIASRLVRRFVAELRAAALRLASSLPASAYLALSSPASLRCAPLNAAVYVQDMLRSWPLRAELPSECAATDTDTEEGVRLTVKECVAHVAAQVCRPLEGVPRSAEAWWSDPKRALDNGAEEACGLFAMQLAHVFGSLPPAVRPRFLKQCAGQLQALLLDRFAQLLVHAPSEDMVARLRSLHALASRLLSPYAPSASLLRTLSALLRVAEGTDVSHEALERLPESLLTALVSWREALR